MFVKCLCLTLSKSSDSVFVPFACSVCPLNPSQAFLKDEEEKRWATWAASVGPPGSLPLGDQSGVHVDVGFL